MSWKDEERRVARMFDGKRTGPLGSNVPDVITDTLAIEVKQRKELPKWLWEAIDQARTNARDKIPIVILHEKFRKRRLVLMEIDTLLDITGSLTWKTNGNRAVERDDPSAKANDEE